MAAPTTHVSTVASQVRRVFSQRVQAAALSVALVVTSALPVGVAVAQEADQEREGVAAPEPTTPPDSTTDPDFDPGGDTALPFDLGAPAGGGDDDSGDGAPVDVEPVTDPEALAVPLDDPAAMAPDALDGGTDAPAPPAEPVPPTPLPAPAPVAPAPAPPPPAATAPPQANADQQTAGGKRDAARAKRAAARKRQRDRARQRPAVQVTIPAPAPTPPAPVPTTAAEPVQAATSPAPDRPRPGRSTYTVQRDDSLWKIASALLGSGATDAEIVAESNRLYGLNRDVIGGDPNMLIAGTVLRLR